MEGRDLKHLLITCIFSIQVFSWVAAALVYSHPGYFSFLYMFRSGSHLILFGISKNPCGNYSSCVYDDALNIGITWTYNQNGGYQISFYNLKYFIWNTEDILIYRPCACSQYQWVYRLVRSKNFWHMEGQVSQKKHRLNKCQYLNGDNSTMHGIYEHALPKKKIILSLALFCVVFSYWESW